MSLFVLFCVLQQNWCPICRAVLSGSENPEEKAGPVAEEPVDDYRCEDMCHHTHKEGRSSTVSAVSCDYGGGSNERDGVARSLQSVMYEAAMVDG
jgi:hypothetical protein